MGCVRLGRSRLLFFAGVRSWRGAGFEREAGGDFDLIERLSPREEPTAGDLACVQNYSVGPEFLADEVEGLAHRCRSKSPHVSHGFVAPVVLVCGGVKREGAAPGVADVGVKGTSYVAGIAGVGQAAIAIAPSSASMLTCPEDSTSVSRVISFRL